MQVCLIFLESPHRRSAAKGQRRELTQHCCSLSSAWLSCALPAQKAVSHMQVTPSGGTGAGCSSHGSSAEPPTKVPVLLSPGRRCSKVAPWVCTLSSFCASRLRGQWMLTLPRISLVPSPTFSPNQNSQAQPCFCGSSLPQSQSPSTTGPSPQTKSAFTASPSPPEMHLYHWKCSSP